MDSAVLTQAPIFQLCLLGALNVYGTVQLMSKFNLKLVLSLESLAVFTLNFAHLPRGTGRPCARQETL